MIIGERLRLRAVERTDLPLFVRWMNDPEVRRFLLMKLPISMAFEEQWFEKMIQRPQAEQVWMIDANLRDRWTPIGSTGFHEVNTIHRSAELGISIGEKTCWNQGFGKEAVRLMLQVGFNILNLHRVYLEVFAANARAIRVYEQVGFQLEGRKRDAHYLDGAYMDVLMMSVLKAEWLAQQQADR